MKYSLMALIALSGSAAAQERRLPPDGCCIPQNRPALRAEYLRGRCLAKTLDRMTCPEVYARFDLTRGQINDSSLNQFGRLNSAAVASAPTVGPVGAMAPPPPSAPSSPPSTSSPSATPPPPSATPPTPPTTSNPAAPGPVPPPSRAQDAKPQPDAAPIPK